VRAKAEALDAFRGKMAAVTTAFAGASDGVSVVECREVCGRYYQLAAEADLACGLRTLLGPAGATAHPSCSFGWSDAFSGRVQAKSSDWDYERACTLFNLAASLSCLANAQPNVQAFKTYQEAAGALDSLAEMVRRGAWRGCDDLSADTVRILRGIMLAQAQRCLYLKHREDHMDGQGGPPEVAAMLEKVAAEAAAMYAETSELLRAAKRRPFTQFSLEWLGVVECNRLLFDGLAQFHAAKTNEANARSDFALVHEYGHQVARLAAASAQTAAAVEACRKAPPAVLDHFSRFHAVVEAAYSNALKDHQDIYSEYRVPRIEELTACRRMAPVAKAKPPPELLT